MSGWLLSTILAILLIATVMRQWLIHYDLKKVSRQLNITIQDFETNEFIRTYTHNKSLSPFILELNKSIRRFRQDKQLAQRKEKELKQEMTNLSHDIRTPLTSIKGFAELLGNPELTEDEKQEYVRIIQKKIDHLSRLADSFYDLFQLESSDKPLHIKEVDLLIMTVDTMLVFYNDFEKRQLSVRIHEDKVPTVMTDPGAANRILVNLVQNALWYARSYVSISFVEDTEYVRLQITNDVENFDRGSLDRIFDRTYRADTSRTGGQLGLGLHIVHQLIQKVDGQVKASVEGDEFIIEVSFMKWN